MLWDHEALGPGWGLLSFKGQGVLTLPSQHLPPQGPLPSPLLLSPSPRSHGQTTKGPSEKQYERPLSC